MNTPLFRDTNGSYEPNKPIYESQSRMIEWVHLALKALPLKSDQQVAVKQMVEKLQSQNPDELHDRARRAMNQMFDAGGSGNSPQAFLHALLGSEVKTLKQA